MIQKGSCESDQAPHSAGRSEKEASVTLRSNVARALASGRMRPAALTAYCFASANQGTPFRRFLLGTMLTGYPPIPSCEIGGLKYLPQPRHWYLRPSRYITHDLIPKL